MPLKERKFVPLELLTTPGPLPPAHDGDTPKPRAVYLFLRPCLQTYQGTITKYLNLIHRLFENRISISHWGVTISTEHPPPEIAPGNSYTLRQHWTKTSTSFELNVPGMDNRERKIDVGSCERFTPTDFTYPRQEVHVYLGTTCLSDEQVEDLGELVVRFMVQEGHGYHGIYRNCQQFVLFLGSLMAMFPEWPLPSRADEMFWGSLWLFKSSNRDIRKRVEQLKEFYLKEIAERIHAWKSPWRYRSAFCRN